MHFGLPSLFNEIINLCDLYPQTKLPWNSWKEPTVSPHVKCMGIKACLSTLLLYTAFIQNQSGSLWVVRWWRDRHETARVKSKKTILYLFKDTHGHDISSCLKLTPWKINGQKIWTDRSHNIKARLFCVTLGEYSRIALTWRSLFTSISVA